MPPTGRRISPFPLGPLNGSRRGVWSKADPGGSGAGWNRVNDRVGGRVDHRDILGAFKKEADLKPHWSFYTARVTTGGYRTAALASGYVQSTDISMLTLRGFAVE